MKKLIVMILSLLLGIFIMGCVNPMDMPVVIKSITLVAPPNSDSLYGPVTLTPQLETTSKGIENPISWKSSDTSVATVDQNGVVTPHMGGSVTITASADGVPDASVDLTFNDVRLIGTWKNDLDDIWIFNTDGTAKFYGTLYNWSTSGSKVFITTEPISEWEYSIDGTSLTLHGYLFIKN